MKKKTYHFQNITNIFSLKYLLILAIIIYTTQQLVIPDNTFAVTAKFWKQTTNSDFNKGNINNVIISNEYKIKLAPKTETINGIDASYVWSMAKNKSGDVYIGTGNPGVLYKITEQKNVIEVFRPSGEMHIQSIVIDNDDNIYAATSPRGVIYKIDTEMNITVFSKLPEFYIWDMVIDKTGNLFAATGPDGKLYSISANGNTTVVLDSEAAHILDLEVDTNNNLYACTSPFGLIYKISGNKDISIIYDAKEDEVHCLAVTKDGSVFIGTADGGRSKLIPAQNPNAAIAMLAQQTTGDSLMNAGNLNTSWPDSGLIETPVNDTKLPPENMDDKKLFDALMGSLATPIKPSKQNSIYKIRPDGKVQKVLNLANSFIYRLIPDNTNRNSIFIGTANGAAIYHLDQPYRENPNLNLPDEIESLFESPSSQILSMIMMDNQEFYVGTGNNATVFKVANQYSCNGTYESTVHDTKGVTRWGRISCETDIKEGTTISITTRTGNSSIPDQTWSKWSNPVLLNSTNKKINQSSKIESPEARFIQYQASLSTIYPAATPILKQVTLSYLPVNNAPEIANLSITNNIKTTPPQQEQDEKQELEQEGKQEVTILSSESKNENEQTKLLIPLKINWKIQDPDKDKLQFNIYYQQLNATEWKPVVENIINTNTYTWKPDNIPDGNYLLKITATDRLSNPLNISLQSESVNLPFIIDNTFPEINKVTITFIDNNHCQISGTVDDAISQISSIKYSINSGPWNSLFPTDEIFDYKTEDFAFTIAIQKEVPQTVTIIATDTNTNTGEKVVTLKSIMQ